MSTSQIISKKIDKLKFGIYIIESGNNFMINLYDHGILFGKFLIHTFMVKFTPFLRASNYMQIKFECVCPIKLPLCFQCASTKLPMCSQHVPHILRVRDIGF
jgi:hypothetical protein